jgi:hypothetical protein
MKHINPKIARLLHEGISMSTLENMSNDQLNLLYNKIVKEQTVPPNKTETVTATKTTVPQGGNATVAAGSKVEVQGNSAIITTTETELGEEEKVGKKKEVKERAKSKKQQQFFGIVRGMQKGDTPKKGKAGEAAKEMKQKDVKDFAKTKHKGLPEKVKPKKKETKEEDEVKKLEENIMSLVEKHLYPEFSKRDLLKNLNKR